MPPESVHGSGFSVRVQVRFGLKFGRAADVVEKRRTSSYFIPIAQPKKKGKQLQFETEWTSDRLEENRLVNLIRERVGQWRKGGHVDVTATTSRLLTYWTNPETPGQRCIAPSAGRSRLRRQGRSRSR